MFHSNYKKLGKDYHCQYYYNNTNNYIPGLFFTKFFSISSSVLRWVKIIHQANITL